MMKCILFVALQLRKVLSYNILLHIIRSEQIKREEIKEFDLTN